jgi:hypothetical protein
MLRGLSAFRRGISGPREPQHISTTVGFRLAPAEESVYVLHHPFRVHSQRQSRLVHPPRVFHCLAGENAQFGHLK